MSVKLLEEAPLLVIKSLATDIGLNEAIVLQQFFYRCQLSNAEVRDGKRWVKASMPALQLEFPFWSESTIERTVKALKDGGWLESKRHRDGNDYTVDTPRTLQLAGSAPATSRDEKQQDDASPSKEEEGKDQGELFGGEPAVENQEDQVVSEVWAQYVEVYGDKLRVKDVTPARRRMILKAWKAVGENVEVLKASIRGLKSYREGHDPSKDTALSVIFETGPHSMRNLTDQISWWADQDDGQTARASDPLASVPAVQRAVVSDRMRIANRIIQGRPLDDNARAEAQEAIEWLHSQFGLRGTLTDDKTVKWERTW